MQRGHDVLPPIDRQKRPGQVLRWGILGGRRGLAKQALDADISLDTAVYHWTSFYFASLSRFLLASMPGQSYLA